MSSDYRHGDINKRPTSHKAHQISGSNYYRICMVSKLLSHLDRLIQNILLQSFSLTVCWDDDTIYVPRHEETNKVVLRPAQTQISLGVCPVWPDSLLSVLKGNWGSKLPPSGQQRLWPAWANAQADLSLRWAHIHFVGFVVSRLI